MEGSQIKWLANTLNSIQLPMAIKAMHIKATLSFHPSGYDQECK